MKPSYEELEIKLEETQRLLRIAIDRITALEEQIKKNSKNSSKPPSTDQKANTSSGTSKPRNGRQGTNRTNLPPEEVDHFITCTLGQCPCCNSSNLCEKGSPLILQQVEIPKVKGTVTEFSCTKYRCNSCGKTSYANLPSGVPNSAFGPQLMGLIATLTGGFHLSKRDAIQLVKDLYGISLSEGSIINVEERVAEALKEVDDRIHRFVMTSSLTKHFDETSWRNSGKNHFVWIGSNAVAAVYRIDASRSKEAFLKFAKGLSNAPVVTDRYGVYSHLENPHQYCLAHLIRDFRGYAERDGPDGKLGEALRDELKHICKTHRQFKIGEIAKGTRASRFRQSRVRLEEALLDGLANGTDQLAGLCDRLLSNMSKLWTFSAFTDVDPTNNLAERDLRKIVLWRKKSYGTRSDRGKRFVERITSVTATVRKAGQNVLDFVTRSVQALYSGESAPSISPILGF